MVPGRFNLVLKRKREERASGYQLDRRRGKEIKYGSLSVFQFVQHGGGRREKESSIPSLPQEEEGDEQLAKDFLPPGRPFFQRRGGGGGRKKKGPLTRSLPSQGEGGKKEICAAGCL